MAALDIDNRGFHAFRTRFNIDVQVICAFSFFSHCQDVIRVDRMVSGVDRKITALDRYIIFRGDTIFCRRDIHRQISVHDQAGVRACLDAIRRDTYDIQITASCNADRGIVADEDCRPVGICFFRRSSIRQNDLAFHYDLYFRAAVDPQSCAGLVGQIQVMQDQDDALCSFCHGDASVPTLSGDIISPGLRDQDVAGSVIHDDVYRIGPVRYQGLCAVSRDPLHDLARLVCGRDTA